MPSGTFPVSVDWSGGTAEIRWATADDSANNRSTVYVELWAHTSGFTTTGTGTWQLRIGDDATSSQHVTIGSSWVRVAARTRVVGHNSNGSLTIAIGVASGEVIGTSWNSTNGVQNVALTTYARLPGAPTNLTVRGVQTQCFDVDYTRNSVAPFDRPDQAEWALDSAFTSIAWTDNSSTVSTGPCTATPPFQLNPGTLYYVRIRSHTAAGWGPWSNTISQTTLPATPPTLAVVSTPSGTAATLTFTAPGGVTGVTKYTWERRDTGTTTPVASGDSLTSIATVTDLLPGASYDWRATAWFGTYQSPATAWITRVQNKPNTNPGDYFDGATTDSADLNYQWGTDGLGAPNASISTAIASGVDGWEVEFASGAGMLYRVTAGIAGSTYAARVQVTQDTTAAGAMSAGLKDASPSWSDVTQDGTFVGSIYVKPSRSQRLAAQIVWMTAAGVVISRTSGVAAVVANTAWVRLSVTGVAPTTAVKAVVRVVDVTGTGWSTWKGGDVLDLDAAMLTVQAEFPYFDGSFADDGTYAYEWVNDLAPHASTSKRTALAAAGGRSAQSGAGASALALVDPNCIPPAPPRPPTIPSDCITEAGVWRRVMSTIRAELVSDWLDVVPTFELVTITKPVSQVRIRIYENPSGGPPTETDTTHWVSEQIISYIPPHTVLTVDGMHQRVWAEVNGAASVSADHLLYGSNGTPAVWPVISCGISYVVSIDLPIDILQEDSFAEIYLTTRY